MKRSGLAPATLWRILSGQTTELIARTAAKLGGCGFDVDARRLSPIRPAEDVRKHRSELGFKGQESLEWEVSEKAREKRRQGHRRHQANAVDERRLGKPVSRNS